MPEFSIDVKTRLPRAHYKHLLAIAEANDSTVGELIAELVRRGITPKKGAKRILTAAQTDQVKEFAALHYSDAEIGRRLKVSANTIYRYRHELDLPSSRDEIRLTNRNEVAA